MLHKYIHQFLRIGHRIFPIKGPRTGQRQNPPNTGPPNTVKNLMQGIANPTGQIVQLGGEEHTTDSASIEAEAELVEISADAAADTRHTGKAETCVHSDIFLLTALFGTLLSEHGFSDGFAILHDML